MTPEELKALWEKLKAEGLSDEDAHKLITEAFDAANRGLIQKRDELLAQEGKLKEKITTLEADITTGKTKVMEVEAQLKKNNPEEYKKYYEGQAKELEAKHTAEVQTLTTERDKFRDSHYARVRDDAINSALKDVKFVEGLRDGFIALAMLKNQFKPTEIDGKTMFTNQENKTIEAVLHELTLSKEGSAYIRNTSSGGGSNPGNPAAGGSGGASAKSMDRKAFDSLNNVQKMEFIQKGGQVTDTAGA